MSIYSDHKCGAMSDDEYHDACARENRRDRWEERVYCNNIFDNDTCMECSSYEDCLHGIGDE